MTKLSRVSRVGLFGALIGLAGAFSLGAGCAGSGPAPEDATAPPATVAKGGGEEPSGPPAASAMASNVYTSTPAATEAPAVTAAPVATAEPAVTASATAAPNASGAASAAPSAAAKAEPAGTNLRIGSMSVDGLTLEDVACKADGLGVFGSMIVVGAISKKKAALNACAPKGDKPRVEWIAAGGKLGSIKVKASTPAIEACVAKALAGAAAPFEGTCAATIVLGK